MSHPERLLGLYPRDVDVVREALHEYADRRNDLAEEAFRDGGEAGYALAEDAAIARALAEELA